MKKRIYGYCLGILLAFCVGCGSSASDVEQRMTTAEGFYSEEQYDKAIDAYLEVLDLDSKNEDAYIGLIDAYIANGEYEAAESTIKEAGLLFESKKLERRAEKLKGLLSDGGDNTTNADNADMVTPEPTSTSTPVLTATNTPVPTATNTPVPTATNTPVPTATNTPVPTATSTPTPSPTPVSDYFVYEIEDGAVTIVGVKKGYPSDIKIPKKLEGLPVTVIGKEAFYKCDKLTSVSIPEGVTSIGERAFCSCSNLTSVSIPGSVTNIGGYAFYETKWLEKKGEENPYVIVNKILIDGSTVSGDVEIPNGVISIGETAFFNCDSLENISIPSSVISIGKQAFAECDSLRNVYISSGVISIDEYAFLGCDNLTNVSIPSSVTYIVDYAFAACGNLTIRCEADSYAMKYAKEHGYPYMIEYAIADSECFEYEIENGTVTITDLKARYLSEIGIPEKIEGFPVTRIGDGAFGWCDNIKGISIPSTVTSIGNFAFQGCSMTNISIPDSVTSIGEGAFQSCYNLTNVSIPSSVTSIGEYTFNWCDNLTSISIPNSVTSIGDDAFAWCRKITSISISNGVTSIGKRAFEGCENLTSVSIPNSVTSIGDSAFAYCDNLASVSIPSSVTCIGQGAFEACFNLVIQCETNSYALTYAKENWYSYKIKKN